MKPPAQIAAFEQPEQVNTPSKRSDSSCGVSQAEVLITPRAGGGRRRSDMLREWLTSQLDYLLFLRGLSFVVLAVLCRRLAGRIESRLPWRWLELFGLLQGLHAWLGVLALSYGNSSLSQAVRLAILAASLLALVEFGRNGLLRAGRPRFGLWFPLVLCGLAAVSVLTGAMAGLDATCRYALGLPGGLLATVVLLRSPDNPASESRRGARLAACFLMMYGLATATAATGASFVPAAWLNHESFLAATGLPIQFVKALCAIGVLTGVWIQEGRRIFGARQPALKRKLLYPAACAVLLALGWFAADWRGRSTDVGQRARLLKQAAEVAEVITSEQAKSLSFTSADEGTPAFVGVRGQLTACGDLMAVRGVYSLAVRDGTIRFGPENYAEDDPQASPPGTPYEHPPPGLWDIFRTGRPFTQGPYTDEYGTFVSAFVPKVDPKDGGVLIVIGLDVEATEWRAGVCKARLIPIIGTLILVLCLSGGNWAVQRREPAGPLTRGLGAGGAESRSGSFAAIARSADIRSLGLLIGMGALAVAFLAVVLFQSWYWARQHIQTHADQQARLAVEFDRALRAYAGKNIRPEMEKRVEPGEFVPEAMSTSFISRAVFEGVRETFPGAVLRFPSTNPRNPVNQATPSERKIIRYFEERPEADSWAGTMRLLDEGETFFVRAIPQRFKAGCLHCHGRPEDAPAAIRERYGDIAGFGRKIGEVSADLAAIPVGTAYEAASGQVWARMLGAVVLCIAFVVGIAILIRKDTVQRRNAEDTLRESEERFRTVSEQTGQLLYDWKISTGEIVWAGRTQDIVGYSLEEMNSHGIEGWTERVHPQDRQRTTALLDAAMRKHEVFACDYRFRRADGTYVDMRDEGVFLYRQSDQAARMLGVMKDVSEQKRAEEELHTHMAEVERFNRIALGREHRIIELKRRINELSEMLGQSPPHPVPAADDLELGHLAANETLCLLPAKESEAAAEDAEFELSELFDLEEMQRLLDSFCGVVGIAAALIDLQGKVLIGSRCQRICTDFHRVNAQTLERCIESDTKLANQLKAGEPFTIYQCCNGLTDAASPVKIGRRHVANVFVGQFLLEPADEQAFCSQAAEFGFERAAYLQALKEVPLVQREKLPLILDFLVSFAGLAANMGLQRLHGRQSRARLSKHAAELDRQRKAALNLAEDAEAARISAERSKAALKDSEERFRTVVGAARDAIVVMGPQGEITLWSPGAEAMFGWSADEVLGKPVHSILASGRCREAHAKAMPVFYATGQGPIVGKTIELVTRHKDGREFPVDLSLSALEMNGHWGAVAILRDITERKLAEEKLRAAMEQAKELEIIIDRSPATAWLWKAAPDWPVEYVSESIAAFGYTPDDFTSGRVAFGDIIHPDDLSRVNAEVEQHVKEGRTEFTQEYRIVTRGGEVRWLDDWTWVRRAGDGETSHYQGITLDVTERKLAEEEQSAHLRFLESMERVDRAIRETKDLDRMLNDVLDVALSVFGCDRAWLLYPCDPQAPSWQIPFERAVPEYPGACREGAVVPMNQEGVDLFAEALAADGAVTCGPQAQHPLPLEMVARFHVQSQIAVAVHTRLGSPWLFGLHQCSRPRIWTDDEKRIFEEIGRRIGDSLTTMLTLHDLRESEQRFRALVDQASDVVLLFTKEGQILDANQQAYRSLGYSREELLLTNINEIDLMVKREDHREQLWNKLEPGQHTIFEGLYQRKDGSTYPAEVSLGVLELEGQRVLLGLSRDISERKRTEEELRAAARTDKLTGLPNRALFLDRLQQAVLRAGRLDAYNFAVLFLDFDRFKIINDSLGHKVGDMLLQEAAERLRAAVRSGDSLGRFAGGHTTARLGGDEFVVLLDGVRDPKDARIVAGRLLDALSRPYRLGKHEVYSSASIGIVTSDIEVTSAEDVLRDADTAMYEAKLAGKGCYVVFDVSMRKRVQNRLSIENDLRKAIESGQLFLMYQPIVSLETREVNSFEVLVRWQHPQRGVISPAEFVPIAEDTGLIVPIGEWVLREACRQFAHWQKTHGDAAPRNIAVNLSRSQLLLSDLPSTIQRILQGASLRPSSLHLEITESAVMRDVELVMKILHALKEIGVTLSMDDFGTGHSSLACLHQFPFDVLKIDRSFIATINQGRDHAALVHAVVSLARNLEINVVAEGIETADQLLMLQALGCHFGQGYFLGRPMMADQVIGYKVPLAVEPNAASLEREKVAVAMSPDRSAR